jgi:glycine dehydrogenase subunit 2
MHEFVCTTRGGRVDGLRAMDVAKRLLDYGIYAPTVYFPTTVPEALMFEPTETESKQSLDLLADVCAAIVADAARDLPFIQAAPHNTPVERVDEVGAARRPVLRWGDSLREQALPPSTEPSAAVPTA